MQSCSALLVTVYGLFKVTVKHLYDILFLLHIQTLVGVYGLSKATVKHLHDILFLCHFQTLMVAIFPETTSFFKL